MCVCVSLVRVRARPPNRLSARLASVCFIGRERIEFRTQLKQTISTYFNAQQTIEAIEEEK